MPPANELRPNVEVDEWKTGKLLGRGGQGAVWEVRSTMTQNMPPRALKACFAEDERARARFVREVELLDKCASPYVVTKLAAQHDWIERVPNVAPFAYYVMEKCTASLDSLQHDLDIGRRLALFRDACRSLLHLHTRPEPVIHRDIKPSNFLLAEEPRRLVLTDFGIAREMLESTLSATQEIVGSKYYRAPEILQGDSGSVQSDVYSLGRVLEWLLTGDVSRTFETRAVPTGRELADDACAALDRVIEKATQVAASNRYASVQELLDALPDVWFALKPKPVEVPATADFDGAVVVPLAIDLARSKDYLGWRQLEGRLRSAYPDRVTAWRADNEKPLQNNQQLIGAIDRLVEAGAGRIVLPLVGVYSEVPALVDQRHVLEDLIQIPGWRDVGFQFAVAAPRGLAYLFHHLHGALCCSLGRFDLALQLVETLFPAADAEYGRLRLWRLPDMHGPKLFERRTTAWEYAIDLRRRRTELTLLFPLQRDFDVGLAAYSMLMCLLELAYDGAQALELLNSERIKVIENFDVPPMFDVMPSEVRRAAVARTFGSKATVATVVEMAGADHAAMKAIWPKWKLGLNRWALGQSWDGTDELQLGELA